MGGDKNYWLIDGRPLKAKAGTVYKITFEWGEKVRRIGWETVNEVPPEVTPLGTDFKPSCFIVGSWSRWSQEEMRPVSTADAPVQGLDARYEFTFKMGERCMEEFQFLL